jgi:nucleotide-binding universal stress UspA family protein
MGKQLGRETLSFAGETMLKDILVVLEETDRAAIPYALSFAKRVEARLTALWPRRDLSLLADGSLEARHAAMRGDREARNAKAREALSSFSAQASAAGVEAEALDYDDPHAIQPMDAPAFARGFDLVVVEQVEPGRPPTLNDLAGAILAESGRPVVVVPGIQRDSARFDRIVAAWDGSQAAARAIGDAAPLLARAKHVEIVAANAAVLSQPVVNGGERIARRFARLGVEASFHRLPGDGDAANLLLSHAADFGADMIVAGGYGHSRLREALTGGVTRTLLGSMTVPVFMSH